MNFVLDTNAVSETEKPRPNPGFMTWLDAQDPARLFITTISVGEVWNGFHSLEPNHRDYNRVKMIATNLPRKYRVLNFDPTFRTSRTGSLGFFCEPLANQSGGLEGRALN